MCDVLLQHQTIINWLRLKMNQTFNIWMEIPNSIHEILKHVLTTLCYNNEWFCTKRYRLLKFRKIKKTHPLRGADNVFVFGILFSQLSFTRKCKERGSIYFIVSGGASATRHVKLTWKLGLSMNRQYTEPSTVWRVTASLLCMCAHLRVDHLVRHCAVNVALYCRRSPCRESARKKLLHSKIGCVVVSRISSARGGQKSNRDNSKLPLEQTEKAHQKRG